MKFLRIFSLILTIIFLIIQSQSLAEKPYVNEGATVTVLGDSIAAGIGAEDEDHSYASLFKEFLEQEYTQVQLLNEAQSGDKSSELLEKLEYDNPGDPDDPKSLIRREVKNSKIITVSIGGNNLLSGVMEFLNGDVTNLDRQLEQFENEWPRIASELRSLAPEAEIYVMTLYNPFNKGDAYNSIDLYSASEYYVRALNSVITKSPLVKRYGYRVIDVYSRFKSCSAEGISLTHFYDHPGKYSDPHPNDKGHEEIAMLHKKAFLTDHKKSGGIF